MAEQLVSLSYRVDDDGSDERRAWVKLRDALCGVATPAARES